MTLPARPFDSDRPWYAYAEQLLPANPGRWADLGCGQGEFLERARVRAPAVSNQALANPAASPLALERDLRNARAARRSGAAPIAADLECGLPLASRSLDGASLVEVIEHIVRAECLVDELARVIRPGGWLIVTTPNVAHLTYRIRAVTGHPPKQEGYHFRFFTASTLRACFESRGFHIEARQSFGKQALLTKLGRLAGRGPGYKFRYRAPEACEPLLAQHFVWRLRRSLD